MAVGPVHAGIIEPGHFRFQCHGEKVFHLEISLGYQHRGIERHLVGGPTRRTCTTWRRSPGTRRSATRPPTARPSRPWPGSRPGEGRSSSAASRWSWSGWPTTPATSARSRATSASCPPPRTAGASAATILNLTRAPVRQPVRPGLIRPGGVGFDLDEAAKESLLERLDAAERDTASAVNLLWDSARCRPGSRNRGGLGGGRRELGLVGPAARACGLERDVRTTFPPASTASPRCRCRTWSTGDVFARAYVRWLEIQLDPRSSASSCRQLPEGALQASVPALMPESIVVSLVEGWRGEICHVALTDAAGRSAATRSWTRRSTTGRAWRWPCAASRSRTSRCATRASTCRTAGTTCDSSASELELLQGHRTMPFPDGPPPELPARFRGRPEIDAAPVPVRLPRVRRGLSDRGDHGRGVGAIDLGRCLFCTDCMEACPEGAISFTNDYRLAVAPARGSRGPRQSGYAPARRGARGRSCAACSAGRSSCARCARAAATGVSRH